MACVTLKKSSNWWYGRYKVDGREYTKNLKIEVRGLRPEKLTETGSKQFELSRMEAQATLNLLLRDIEKNKSEEQLAHAVYQARTGGQNIPTYKIGDLKKTLEGYAPKKSAFRTIFATVPIQHWPVY